MENVLQGRMLPMAERPSDSGGVVGIVIYPKTDSQTKLLVLNNESRLYDEYDYQLTGCHAPNQHAVDLLQDHWVWDMRLVPSGKHYQASSFRVGEEFFILTDRSNTGLEEEVRAIMDGKHMRASHVRYDGSEKIESPRIMWFWGWRFRLGTVRQVRHAFSVVMPK